MRFPYVAANCGICHNNYGVGCRACFECKAWREGARARGVSVSKPEAHRIVRMFGRHHVVRVRFIEGGKRFEATKL